MKMAGTAAAGCLILLVALAGCGKKKCEVTYVRRACDAPVTANTPTRPPMVAVMPFRCDAAPEVGYRVSEVMAGQLGTRGGCLVVAPAVVVGKTEENMSPAECGRMVGAPYVITGEVVEYVGSAEDGDKPTIGVSARMMETASGKVVWSESRTRSGTAAWYPEDSVGVLTARVCGDLAVCVNEAWPEIDVPQQAARRGSAAVPVPAVEVDEELVEIVEHKDIELPDTAELIDFPEEADSPDQFGLEMERDAPEADDVAEQPDARDQDEPKAAAPMAPEKDAAEDMAHLPVVPEKLSIDNYILPPEEAARVLEMFEDPYTPDLAKAKAMPQPEGALPAEEPLELAVEPETPEATADIAETPASTEVLPPPITVESPVAIPEPSKEVAMPSLPVLPAPSEELVPVSIGVELDEKDFPLASPAVLPPPAAKPEYGLDDDKSFAAPLALPVAAEEDELDFFGKMSANLGLEMVE